MTPGSKLIQRLKKKKPTWKNTTVTYLLCNCAASPHHSATMQHHNAKLTILVKLKSQTICEKLNLTIDDPIICLQENQLFFPFSIFKSSSKSVSFFVIEVPNLRCFSLKAYPQNFLDFASPSLSKSIIVEIYHCFFFSFFAF